MTVSPGAAPGWLQPLVAATRNLRPADLRWATAPADASLRRASVLLLFGGDDTPSDTRHLLLLERAHDMRSHAGQIAFPGGAEDADDPDEAATALREAHEETGLDPAGVEVIATLPSLWVPPSNFSVTPVVAWWRTPSHVSAVDPAETASVHRVALSSLLDPRHRVSIRHPSGYVGPAFLVDDLLVWGFTAGVLSRLFAIVGWERPWDEARIMDLPPELSASGSRAQREQAEL